MNNADINYSESDDFDFDNEFCETVNLLSAAIANNKKNPDEDGYVLSTGTSCSVFRIRHLKELSKKVKWFKIKK